MGHLQVLLLAFFFSQVLGNPMMFYSQPDPDCSQQQSDFSQPDTNSQNYQTDYQSQGPAYQSPSNQASSYQGSGYPAPSYQGASYQSANYPAPAYQGPSYQDTYQAMILETLRALCSIVQSTVSASKQEIETMVKLFIQKASGSNCNSGGEQESMSHVSSPSISEVSNSIVDPQKGHSEMVHSTSNSNLLEDRFAVENNSTTPSQEVDTMAMKSNSSATAETLPTDKNTTALPLNSSSEVTTSNNTVEMEKPTNDTNTITP